jgi:hypothetical protein
MGSGESPTSTDKVVNEVTTTAGQTVIAGSYADGDVLVVNKSDLKINIGADGAAVPITAFTGYAVVDGDIVLTTPAAEGDNYLVIPRGS